MKSKRELTPEKLGEMKTKRMLTLEKLGEMKSQRKLAVDKLMKPRMSVGLMVLHSLLEPLKGTAIKPSTVKKTISDILDQKKDNIISKQSITNAAIRLEEANMLDRKDGYKVNYGYLISVLLNSVIELTERIRDLEDEIAELKEVDTTAT